MSESERRFLVRLNGLAPGAPGYGDQASRVQTDILMRGALAETLSGLRAKLGELIEAAEEEGEEDMRDDLGRIDERMERTGAALGDPAHLEAPFFTREDLQPADRDRVCGYDLQLLEDAELLRRDVLGLRYETIGSLTLREVEGTLAAIELRLANRKDVLEGGT
jgi:hypothetical protein